MGVGTSAVWTFHADVYTGPGQYQPAGPVRCSAFSYTQTLSDFGSGSASVEAEACPLTDEDLLTLWGWRLFAFRNGVPVFCGVPTGITDSGDVMAPLTLTEISGYLARRVQDQPGLAFGQAEQVQIAATLAASLDQVGVRVVTSTTTPISRDRTYTLYEDTMGTLLTNLTQVTSGPQFRTELTPSADSWSSPQVTLRIAYPQVGADTGVHITVPGNATDYTATWDSDQLRTHTIALGALPDDAAENTPQPVAVIDRPQARIPRLDMADDWSTTVLTTTLAERAETSATQYAVPVLAITATAPCSDPPLGSYGVGDTVAVNVTSPLLAGGLTVTGQLTGLSVDATSDTAQWTVAVAVPAPQPRATLIRVLRQATLGVSHNFRYISRGLA